MKQPMQSNYTKTINPDPILCQKIDCESSIPLRSSKPSLLQAFLEAAGSLVLLEPDRVHVGTTYQKNNLGSLKVGDLTLKTS